MTGVLFIVLSYLLVSLIEGIFGNVVVLFSNMLMGLLIGMVFAIIVASLKGSKAGPARPKIPHPAFAVSGPQQVKGVAKGGRAGI